MIRILSLCCVLFTLNACTEQERAKNFGGSSTTTLASCQKLTMITWKGDSLWLMTRPMRAGETPETYTFKEDSSYGLWEGTVTIKEQCRR